MSIRGVTFDNQLVTASDHGVLFQGVLDDGIVTGMGLSYSTSTLTIAAGYCIVAGRLIQLTAAATLTASSGGNYSRLVVTIDTSQTATVNDFMQVSFSLDYAASPSSFAALTQEDINAGVGNIYQAALAIFTMSGSSFTGVYAGPYQASVSAGYATDAGTAANATLAAAATKLQTARNINVQDASATNTGTAASFNGTAQAMIKLPATIKANITGNCSGSSGSCTGNAATATKLATARNIGSASFNGTANITLAQMGAASTVASSITGAASTLTAFTARRIYIGTSAPTSGVGEQGDLYVVV